MSCVVGSEIESEWTISSRKERDVQGTSVFDESIDLNGAWKSYEEPNASVSQHTFIIYDVYTVQLLANSMEGPAEGLPDLE